MRNAGWVEDAVVLALAQCGGWATRAELMVFVSRRQIARALARGSIEPAGRGHFTTAGADDTRRAAVELNAVISHRSAARLHGWSIRSEPERPELIVPRHRKVSATRRRGLELRWRDLTKAEIQDDLVTTPPRTVVDCARDLPLVEALAVADSALRSGSVTHRELLEQVSGLPRSGRAAATVVLTQASDLAANPFESALRALTIDAVGPLLAPQIEIQVGNAQIRPDLVSEPLRIVIEADSHEFHTQRAQLVRDCWRYDELTLDGWLVLRFSWEHVMRHEEWVRSTVARGVGAQQAVYSSV